MHRRQWLCATITAAVGTLCGPLVSTLVADRLLPLLDVLAGHTLCDTCLAVRARFALPQLRGSVRRISAVLAIDAVQPCERCGTIRSVYSLPRPSRA